MLLKLAIPEFILKNHPNREGRVQATAHRRHQSQKQAADDEQFPARYAIACSAASAVMRLCPQVGRGRADFQGKPVILIAIGSNLPSPALGMPAQICERALRRLDSGDIHLCAISRFFESAPVPASDQPWYVNAVARVDTALSPADLLTRLHAVEQAFGRVRRQVNEARVLDLDLLDYNGQRNEGAPLLPHPRMAQRAFVLLPLRDVAPDWRHPVDGRSLDDLIAALPTDQGIRPVAGSAPRLSGLD